MSRADTAIACTLLLAALGGAAHGVDAGAEWRRGWQSALSQPPGAAAPRLAARSEPRNEYERGYLDGSAHLRDHGGPP